MISSTFNLSRRRHVGPNDVLIDMATGDILQTSKRGRPWGGTLEDALSTHAVLIVARRLRASDLGASTLMSQSPMMNSKSRFVLLNVFLQTL